MTIEQATTFARSLVRDAKLSGVTIKAVIDHWKKWRGEARSGTNLTSQQKRLIRANIVDKQPSTNAAMEHVRNLKAGNTAVFSEVTTRSMFEFWKTYGRVVAEYDEGTAESGDADEAGGGGGGDSDFEDVASDLSASSSEGADSEYDG